MGIDSIASVHIDNDTTLEDAEHQYYVFIKSIATKCGTALTEEKLRKSAKEIVKRCCGYLNCPIEKKKVESIKCFFCQFGHMCECHHPYRCSDPKAKCNHYLSQE